MYILIIQYMTCQSILEFSHPTALVLKTCGKLRKFKNIKMIRNMKNRYATRTCG